MRSDFLSALYSRRSEINTSPPDNDDDDDDDDDDHDDHDSFSHFFV